MRECVGEEMGGVPLMGNVFVQYFIISVIVEEN